jgi:nucleotide-binding universal stress UspA family protein
MVKIERILCPTDLTPESDEALRYAVALAREYDAKLMLCHCTRAAHAVAGADSEEGAKRHFKRVFMESIAPHLGLADFSHLDWEGFVLMGGDVGALITREAAARHADLIVMRSRRRPRAAALLGSTAETVCRTAPCSVLVTHPREREWVGFSTGEICLERVLVAHDFSDLSELGLQYGLSLAGRFKAELHLMHILSEPEVYAPELAWVPGVAQRLYHDTVRRLEEAVPEHVGPRCVVRPVVLIGKPYEKILTYAGENEIDLICIGADGTGRGLHTLFGSNVDRVLRQSPCPVLIARPFKPANGRA